METEATKIDKSKWGPGPWQTEPDRLEWRHVGLPCLMVRVDSHGAWCGYVAVPPGHAYYGKGCDDVDAHAHGGLTYANKCAGHICHVPAEGEPDDVWWLGFDCAHSGDKMPATDALLSAYRSHRFASGDEYRDMAYVQAEVNQLAEQFAAAAE